MAGAATLVQQWVRLASVHYTNTPGWLERVRVVMKHTACSRGLYAAHSFSEMSDQLILLLGRPCDYFC